MRVLVAVASKHGGTFGIGEAIAATLRERGYDADVRNLEDDPQVADPAGYGAVIVGSAVYISQWLGSAKDFVSHNAESLRQVPVWLFSSGLSDVPAVDANAVPDKLEKIADLGARGHRHFSGRLELKDLSIPERAVIAAARGKYGDSRDFAAIEAWVGTIADQLDAGAGA